MCRFKVECAELCETQADKKCPSKYSVFDCFSDPVVTWPCDVIFASHLLDMNIVLMFSISTTEAQHFDLQGIILK